MTIDDKIGDEKLRYDVNREIAKVSALSLVKIEKLEHLAGEKILTFDQNRVIEQVYLFSFRKRFLKTNKSN